MPLFYKLNRYGEDANRVAGRLKALRHAIQNHPDGAERSVPSKNATDTLLLATWNLKEFEGGRNDKRIDESYWYIAEIVSHFDLIAIQEVGGHIGALNRLRRRLGGGNFSPDSLFFSRFPAKSEDVWTPGCSCRRT